MDLPEDFVPQLVALDLDDTTLSHDGTVDYRVADAIARVRAIEEGLAIIRAANGGISAVIDPYGRVQASLALGARGVLDHALPAALPPTPFARFGSVIILVLLLLSATASLWPLAISRT